LAAPPRILLERDQPVALDRALDRANIGDQVGVGRAGPLDDSDAGQKSVPAARSVSVPRGPISR
jgi:hypothetical protein